MPRRGGPHPHPPCCLTRMSLSLHLCRLLPAVLACLVLAGSARATAPTVSYDARDLVVSAEAAEAGGSASGAAGAATYCKKVTDGCFTFKLVAVKHRTFVFLLVNNCKHGLSNASFELPEGAKAAWYYRPREVTSVENPGGTGGPYNPRYRNIKFEFGGDIKRGDAVALAFTLPEGADYADGLRVQAKAGHKVYKATFDPTRCGYKPTPPPTTPPPVEACATATSGCLTAELVEVVTNEDGTKTYDVRLVYNCHKDLFSAAIELPHGTNAASTSTGGLIRGVYNPGWSDGWYGPTYRNVTFKFKEGIRRGESVRLSYTLPAGAEYDGHLRIRTWGGWHAQDLTLDLSECETDVCEADAGPPTITYSVVEENGVRYLEARVADDTALETVSFEEVGTSNLNEVVSARVFTPGEPTAFFKFEIKDITQNAALKGTASDACGNTLCPTGETNEIPTLTARQVVIDDETGTFKLRSEVPNPVAAGFDRFGNLVEASDDTGIVRYETFARNNIEAFQQPVTDCETDGGCDLDPAQPTLSVVMAAIDAPSRSGFGFFVADACNVFVLDPPNPGFAERLDGPEGYVLSCPAFTAAPAASEPLEFALEQNRPNPFTGRSQIAFSMPEAGSVHLAVYDLLGRSVLVLADGAFEKGHHTVPVDAAALPSGTYLYRLTTDHGTALRQMVVAR